MSLILLSTTFSVASAKKPGGAGRRKNGQNPNVDRPSTSDSIGRFWFVIKFVYILVFAPVLIYFFISLARDPAVPMVAKALRNIGKRKIVGFLGRGEEVDIENIAKTK